MNATSPHAAYAMAREGPALARRPPAPRNRPVPMAPPIAIIVMWRGVSDLP